ncbi:MAG: hypothetical protein HY059_16725 [Proteobacteria bacterium]|nr:hypothetical protein [Pseudomonadota bacterium]
MKPIRILLLFAQDSSWSTLSYATSLPRAIACHGHFDVTAVNLARFSVRDEFLIGWKSLFGQIDAVFVLHSAFSNVPYLSDRLADRIAGLRRPVMYFVGNEYKLMPEKMALAERLRTKVLVSQIAEPEVLRLYSERLNCRAIFVPNAIADPIAFPPGPPVSRRKIDIGYRAFDGVRYLGHDDRRRIAELVEPAAMARGRVCDISLDPARRLGSGDWLRFLHDCKVQLAVEAGTDYFELDDRTRLKGNALESERPDIGFEDYRRIVFGGYANRISGRTITSRHLECATARTPMVMFPGGYCGAFEADRHYISLARDGRNLDDVLERIADADHCERIAAAAEAAANEKFGMSALMTGLEAAVRELVE